MNQIDYSISRFFNSFAGRTGEFDSLFVIAAEGIIFLLAFGILLFWLQNKEKKEGLDVFLTALISGVIGRFLVEILHLAFFRARPFITHSVEQLLDHNPLEASFPSGHATVMFAFAFSFLVYKKYNWFAAFACLATLSSLSRVVVGVHYFFDIIGGAFLGLASVYFAQFLLSKAKR